jgi:Na+/melibiose symporter-like transporter
MMTESDHKKAYQEYLKEKTFRTVVIYYAIKVCFYQICGLYTLLYVAKSLGDKEIVKGLGKQKFT